MLEGRGRRREKEEDREGGRDGEEREGGRVAEREGGRVAEREKEGREGLGGRSGMRGAGTEM